MHYFCSDNNGKYSEKTIPKNRNVLRVGRKNGVRWFHSVFYNNVFYHSFEKLQWAALRKRCCTWVAAYSQRVFPSAKSKVEKRVRFIYLLNNQGIFSFVNFSNIRSQSLQLNFRTSVRKQFSLFFSASLKELNEGSMLSCSSCKVSTIDFLACPRQKSFLASSETLASLKGRRENAKLFSP